MAKEEKDLIKIYMNDIKNYKVFTKDQKDLELKAILAAQSGDKNARNQVIQSNLRFVVNIAKQFMGKGLPLEDLISEGNIGLITALDHFKPSLGYKFISYAVHWIRQSILKALGQKTRSIKLPSNAINEINQINKLVEYYSEQNIDPMEFAQLIAEDLEFGVKRVKMLMNFTQDALSLNAPTSTDEGATELISNVADTQVVAQGEMMFDYDLKGSISKALENMDSREADVLRHRFGLEDYKKKTLNEIASILSVTKERVRQIENKAKEHLKEAAGEELGLFVS